MRRLFGVIRFVSFIWLVAAAVNWWRAHPRTGARWVNRVVDPWLVRNGAIDASKGELALLEHVGRQTGLHRVTPVHPVPTADGYRIVVPLGMASEWAQNVLAAGTCRLQVGEEIHVLAEPSLVLASTVEGVAKPLAAVMDWLGFRYLVLKSLSVSPGRLEVAIEGERPVGEPHHRRARTHRVQPELAPAV